MERPSSIFIQNGKRLGGYEDSELDWQWIATEWFVKPRDGANPLLDGEYKGIFLGNGLMRVVYGGEYYNGAIINYGFSDYEITLDEQVLEEYRAGFVRGYRGKRSVTYNKFCKQSEPWQNGYRAGRGVAGKTS